MIGRPMKQANLGDSTERTRKHRENTKREKAAAEEEIRRLSAENADWKERYATLEVNSTIVRSEFDLMATEMRQLKTEAIQNGILGGYRRGGGEVNATGVTENEFHQNPNESVRGISGGGLDEGYYSSASSSPTFEGGINRNVKSRIILTRISDTETFPDHFLESDDPPAQEMPVLGAVDGIGLLVMNQVEEGVQNGERSDSIAEQALNQLTPTTELGNTSLKRPNSTNSTTLGAKQRCIRGDRAQELHPLVTNTVIAEDTTPMNDLLLHLSYKRSANRNIANPVIVPATQLPAPPEILIQMPLSSHESIIRCSNDLIISQGQLYKLIPMQLRASLSNELSLHPLYPPPSPDDYVCLVEVPNDICCSPPRALQ